MVATMNEVIDRIYQRIEAADALGTTRVLLDLKDVKELMAYAVSMSAVDDVVIAELVVED